MVLALVAAVGSVGKTRLALPRHLVRARSGESDADLQRRIVRETAPTLQPDDALLVDAGFSLADLLAVAGLRFVARAPKNLSASQCPSDLLGKRTSARIWGEGTPASKKVQRQDLARDQARCHRALESRTFPIARLCL